MQAAEAEPSRRMDPSKNTCVCPVKSLYIRTATSSVIALNGVSCFDRTLGKCRRTTRYYVTKADSTVMVLVYESPLEYSEFADRQCVVDGKLRHRVVYSAGEGSGADITTDE
ncbi:hypothetical protein MRX96_033382 [Rhipicephalus microplus]